MIQSWSRAAVLVAESERSASLANRYSTTTAVPFADTMSIPFSLPSTS